MRLPLLLPAVGLAACSSLLGPSPETVREAVKRHYDPPAEHADWPLATPELKDATLASVSSCEPMGRYFICPAMFAQSDGARIKADICMVEAPGGWTAHSIVPAETS